MTTGRGASIRLMALWLLTTVDPGEGLTAISANVAVQQVAISIQQNGNLSLVAREEETSTYAPSYLKTDLPEHDMTFGTENNTLVTSQTGSTAYLPCLIHHIGDGIVSWIRKKDYHLLTVGLTTYSSDQRFQAIHLQHSEDWTLQVKYVQKRDAGIYECQVSTHPPTSIFIRLEVVEASAQIFGPSEKYLKPGSALRLQCSIIKTTEAPSYVFWYHNRRMINYDGEHGVNVSVDTAHRTSQLIIAAAAASHTGNYTCVPNNARPASIYVHIFNGENPAAMQSGSTGLWMWWCTSFRLIFIAFIISVLYR